MFQKPARPVDRVFIHCTASNNKALSGDALRSEVERWHKDRGFSEIGYHFLVDLEGTVIPGRSLEKIPAAQQGHNTGTIAISCHGLKPEDFTEAQMAAVAALCLDINEAYSGHVTFHGHCEVSPKLCPVFDYRAVLGLDAEGRMARAAAEV